MKEAVREYSHRFDAAVLSCADAAAVVADAAEIEHMAATVKALAAARAAEGRGWKRSGFRSAEEELARRTGTSVHAARDTLALAKRLADQPEVADAARNGEISPTQASTIADAVADDPGAAGRLLGTATSGGSLAELRSQAAEVKAHAADLEARRQAIHRRRLLRQWTNPNGEWHLRAMGTPEDGAQIMARLEAVAADLLRRARRHGRHEPYEAHRFDALVHLAVDTTPTPTPSQAGDPDPGPGPGPGPGDAGAGPDAGPDPGCGPSEDGDGGGAGGGVESHDTPGPAPSPAPSPPGRDRPGRGAPVKLLIRVDLDTLLRGFPADGETCELVGYGPLSVTAIHKLCQDGDAFVAAILSKGRQLLGVAHLGRKPTAHQRSFLEWLYPTCAAQGCPAVAHSLQIDHRHDWTDTHITLIDWLDGLCAHHHRQKTNHGWSLINGIGKRPFVPPTDPRHPHHRPPPDGPP